MSEATSSSTLKRKSEQNPKTEKASLTPHIKIVVTNSSFILPDDVLHSSFKQTQKTGMSISMPSDALIRHMRFAVVKNESKHIVMLTVRNDTDDSILRYELGVFRSEEKAKRYMQQVQYEALSRLTKGSCYTSPYSMKRWCMNAAFFAVGGVLAMAGTVAFVGALSNLYGSYMLNDSRINHSITPSTITRAMLEPAAIAPLDLEPANSEVTYLPQVDQSRLVQLTELNQKNIELVANVAGIELEKKTPNATPFYVFSRLNCDDCDTVNSILADVAPEFQPIVLPASFQNDIESAQAIAYAYCAENPGQSWVDIAKGNSVESDLLCNWAEKAEVTSKLADLIAVAESPSDWPLIVAPNGKVSKGSFPSDPSVAVQMLNEHLNLNSK